MVLVMIASKQTDYDLRRSLQTKCGRQFSTISLIPDEPKLSLFQLYLKNRRSKWLCIGGNYATRHKTNN